MDLADCDVESRFTMDHSREGLKSVARQTMVPFCDRMNPAVARLVFAFRSTVRLQVSSVFTSPSCSLSRKACALAYARGSIYIQCPGVVFLLNSLAASSLMS